MDTIVGHYFTLEKKWVRLFPPREQDALCYLTELMPALLCFDLVSVSQTWTVPISRTVQRNPELTYQSKMLLCFSAYDKYMKIFYAENIFAPPSPSEHPWIRTQPSVSGYLVTTGLGRNTAAGQQKLWKEWNDVAPLKKGVQTQTSKYGFDITWTELLLQSLHGQTIPNLAVVSMRTHFTVQLYAIYNKLEGVLPGGSMRDLQKGLTEGRNPSLEVSSIFWWVTQREREREGQRESSPASLAAYWWVCPPNCIGSCCCILCW